MKIVYILTNQSMPDTIKIGITDNLERRMKELDNTSTPLPFECYYAVEVQDAKVIEKKIHEGLDDKRIRQNREFFNSTPEQAKAILEIAEFMGVHEIMHDGHSEYELPSNEIVQSLQYHTSWDWLMPVVESCLERLDTRDTSADEIKRQLATCHIDYVYNQVVEFIEEHNVLVDSEDDACDMLYGVDNNQ